MEILGLYLRETCSACPEQYDVFKVENGHKRQVGYFRLRHGYFTAEVPDALGEVVYSQEYYDEGFFRTEEDRIAVLTKACKAILKKIEG